RRPAGGEDVVVGDVDLEGRHAGHRPGRGPDLRRVVRQGGEVVAEEGARRGEPVTGELHPVAGVARQAQDDAVESTHRSLGGEGVAHGAPWPRIGRVRIVGDPRPAAAGTKVPAWGGRPALARRTNGPLWAGRATGAQGPLPRRPKDRRRGAERPAFAVAAVPMVGEWRRRRRLAMRFSVTSCWRRPCTASRCGPRGSPPSAGRPSSSSSGEGRARNGSRSPWPPPTPPAGRSPSSCRRWGRARPN